MKKLMLVAALLLAGSPAFAAVTVSTAPVSLVTSAATVNASSTANLFSFGLMQDASETLTSVAVTVTNETGSSASSADLASVKLLKGADLSSAVEIGSNTSVNVGTPTVIAVNSGSTAISATGDKYFVTLATSASWAQPDKVAVTLPANAVVTSANSPTLAATTTAALSAPDLTGPALSTAVAKGTGTVSGKDAGDSIDLTFNEATNKAAITTANINSVLALNNSHSWLDGNGQIQSATWSDDGKVLSVKFSSALNLPTVAAGDTVTIGGSVIKDSAGNNATGSAAITGDFGVVVAAPALSTAVAKNTANLSGTNAGDSVVLTFSLATNKPAITKDNINTVLALNNSHSWLDGAAAIGSAAWSADGKTLTVTLSAGTSVPTVAPSDTVTVSGSVIKDATAAVNATGTQTISGSFSGSTSTGGDDEEDDFGKVCPGGVIQNGKLYRIEGSNTVYLAAACSLKPFRGAAVFKARGHKFQDIRVITVSQVSPASISDKPALPSGGTLIKGSKSTVWFVTEDGKILGFVSEKAFKRLGFNFGSVKTISDSDLTTMQQGANIQENSPHPEGAVLKCTVGSTVYMMKGNKKLAFTNPQPYLDRGHTWDAIAVVDCGQFQYPTGSNVAQ
ncbi:MAG: hypothetical protein ACM3NH_05045 [Candidatus Saccharibacteria bacterium]